MRQVNEAELMWSVKYALRRIGAAQRNRFKSSEQAVQASAEYAIATRIVEQLRRFEILSDAPLPEGSDLFSRAAHGSSDQPMLGDGAFLKGD